MSEQDGTQPSTKQRRSRKTNTTKQENGKQSPAAQRPANDDTEAWKAYWKSQGQPWRTEPEIDAERQKYLDKRRCIKPDIVQGSYPFKNIKLNRADVEWLLTTHENGCGPIDWRNPTQREREGLAFRGADLRNENLERLPLARLQAGTNEGDWKHAEKLRPLAAIHAEGINLTCAHLEGSTLTQAYLQGAILNEAHLEEADLIEVHAEETKFLEAHLEGAYLVQAHLEGAYFGNAHLEGASLSGAHLEGAHMNRTFFDNATTLNQAYLSNKKYGSASFLDTSWGNVNIAVIDWSTVEMLGMELKARQSTDSAGKKTKRYQFVQYQLSVRECRQLAIVLRDQGLNEDAARFAYRAQLLQRILLRRLISLPEAGVWKISIGRLSFLRRVQAFGSYVFSLFLDLLAGYGYRPGRSVIWYLTIIFGFAAIYYSFGHITPLESFVLSLTSFHGRGFFPSTNITLSDPRVVLAAFEAVVGLLIEISFIATFTQRFFGK